MAAAARDVSSRLIVKIVLVAAATLAALYLIYLVRSVIGIVLIAIFFALAVAPAVNWLHNRRVPRAISILLVYLAIAASIFGIGLLLVPPIANGVNRLSDDLPGYVEDLRNNDTFRRYDDKYNITDTLSKQAEQLPTKLGDAAGTLRDVTVNVFSSLVELFAILVIAFFLLMEGDRILAFLYRQLPAGREERIRTIAVDLSNAIGGYVAGNFVISILAGAVTYVTLALLDVPFAAPLAILFAFFDLIPLVGATLGGIIVGIVVAFVDFPTALIVWAIVLIAYQQVENNLIQPVVYGRTVQIHPLVVIIAILIGAELLGILGALIAIPVAAGVQSLARDIYHYSELGKEQAAMRAEKESSRGDGPNPPEVEPA
jgi:predicted PurR-regulated permease PerM